MRGHILAVSIPLAVGRIRSVLVFGGRLHSSYATYLDLYS